MFAIEGTVLFALVAVAVIALVLLSGLRVIPNDRIGIVEKRRPCRGTDVDAERECEQDKELQPRRHGSPATGTSRPLLRTNSRPRH